MHHFFSRVVRIILLLVMVALLLPMRQAELDITGKWALHWAARWDRLDMLEGLLQRRVSVEQQDDRGYPPLMYAVQLNSNRAVERLLRAGADPNVRVAPGATPLLMATLEENPEVVDRLLAAGAEADPVESICHATPLHVSARNGLAGITARLVEAGAAVERPNRMGVTPLELAVLSRDLATLEVLLRAGARPDRPGGDSIHLATMMGLPGLVEALLVHGAVVDSLDPQGLTPLQRAVYRGEVDMAALLLQAGADPQRRERKEGLTPLHVAAVAPAPARREMIQLLVQHGAELEAKADATGGTPLYYAAGAGRTEAVAALLALGAAVGARADRDFGRSPWQVALLGRHDEIKRLLSAAGAEIEMLGKGVNPPYFAHLAEGDIGDLRRIGAWDPVIHSYLCQNTPLYKKSRPRWIPVLSHPAGTVYRPGPAIQDEKPLRRGSRG